jgi:glycosyltransferase involved in cell wall biosynthesis
MTLTPTDLNIGVYGARGIPSTYSGYETFLSVLLPRLVDRGHSVTMYCRRGLVDGGPYQGVTRVVLPAPPSKNLQTLAHGLVAAACARLARHDVVLAVNVANAPFCLLARATGQRTALNVDGLEWQRGKWGPAARAFFKLSARISPIASPALIADSVAMNKIYSEEFDAQSTIIPYCWTELELSESEDQPRALALPPKYFLIGGRLNPENNLAKVARAYLDADVKTPLVVLGEANYDSPEQRALRSMASQDKRIVLKGHISDRMAYASVVRGAVTYVHAHSVGGINPSLIEAMGCGARVLALDTEFNYEALGEAGTYFHDFQYELPKLLGALDQEDPIGEFHRAAAARRARERFGVEAVTDAYEELLITLSRSHPWRTTTIGTRWQTEDFSVPSSGASQLKKAPE